MTDSNSFLKELAGPEQELATSQEGQYGQKEHENRWWQGSWGQWQEPPGQDKQQQQSQWGGGDDGAFAGGW